MSFVPQSNEASYQILGQITDQNSKPIPESDLRCEKCTCVCVCVCVCVCASYITTDGIPDSVPVPGEPERPVFGWTQRDVTTVVFSSHVRATRDSEL